MNSLTLTVGQVRGLVLIAAKGDVRYYLNGALIDFAKRRAVATDGTVLLATKAAPVSEADEPGDKSVILDRDTLEAISKGGKVTDDVVILPAEDGKVQLIRTGSIQLAITATPIDGRFPEYERIIPHTVSGDLGNYNPLLVARVDKALRLACDATKSGSIAHIGHNGTASAPVFLPGFCKQALAIVMPFRASDHTAADAVAEFMSAA